MQLRLVEYRRQDNSPARRARRRRQFLHDSLQCHGISVHERSVWLRQSGHAHRHADRERPVSGRAYFQRRPRPRTSDGMAQEKTEYHHHVKSLHRVFTTKWFMSLRSPTENENGVCPSTPNSPTSPSFRHAFTRNPETATGPPIKKS